ncbi:MAG: XRE family transcriptional regulator [Methylococcaceae bacterium]|nr:MAG: XRE family transcriptional regulator [Methylococcaceae bacterium]
MNTPTNVQLINGADGYPAFVVVPYAEYVAQYGKDRHLIPNEVAGRVLKDDMTPMKAWREHLGMTQAEVAARLGTTQAAFAQLENSSHPRKSTLRRVANALGLSLAQLDF